MTLSRPGLSNSLQINKNNILEESRQYTFLYYETLLPRLQQVFIVNLIIKGNSESPGRGSHSPQTRFLLKQTKRPFNFLPATHCHYMLSSGI